MGRSKADFYVDWSDPPFPQIYRWREGVPQDAQTLAECKRDITESFQHQINHAKSIIADIRVLHVADIEDSPY